MKKLVTDGYQMLIGFISGIITLFAPAIPVIITVFCFIIADAYYGYQVSKKCGQKHFESNKVWKTVHKLTEALSVIVLALLIDKHILMTYANLSAVKATSGVVCLAEGLSLLESFRALYPHSLLSKILSRVIKSKAEKYLDIDISDIIDLNNNNNTNDNNDNTKRTK